MSKQNYCGIDAERFFDLVGDHIADSVANYIKRTDDKNPVVLCIVTKASIDDKTGDPLLDTATQPMSIAQLNAFKNELTWPNGDRLFVSEQIVERIRKLNDGFQCVIFADGKQILQSFDYPEMVN